MSRETVLKAHAFSEAGRPREAIELLGNALASTPDDPELLDALACVHLTVDPRAALEASERLIAAEPESHRGHVLAAGALRELGRKKPAVVHARRAAAMAPDDALSQLVLAEVVTFKGGNYKEGKRAAERVIELLPDNAIGYEAAGAVELQAGRAKRAIKWYERVLEIDPANTTARKNLAAASKRSLDYGRAFAHTQAVLQFDPQDRKAREAFDRVAYATVVHFLWLAGLMLVFALSMRML